TIAGMEIPRSDGPVGCGGSRSGGGFVVDGAEPAAVAVSAAGVVPGLDPVEHGQGEFVAGLPVALVEELALQRREERFGDAVVEAVPDAAHGAEESGVTEAAPEEPRRV